MARPSRLQARRPWRRGAEIRCLDAVALVETSSRSPSFTRMVSTASGASVVSALPLFLVGALAADMTTELGFGPAGLGGLIAVSRCAGAMAAMPMGVFADRIGPTHALRLACVLASIAAAGIAVVASDWLTTAVWMVLAGCALVLSEPAANSMLVQRVSSQRLGTAFGIKQASLPVASTLSGLSVPLIGLTLGWRWAFAMAIPVAMLTLAAVPRITDSGASAGDDAEPRPRLGHHGTLLLLGAAFGLGTASALAVPAFYVAAAVEAGQGVGLAGTILAAASVTAVLTRVVSGAASDRYIHRPLVFCAVLLIGGAGGLTLLATARPVPMAVGAIIAAAGSWGNSGVFWYALLRAFAHAPGRVTGALAPGSLTGGTLGPLLFGLIASRAGFSAAWLFAAGSALLGAVFMLLGRRGLARALGRPAPSVENA